MSDILDEQFYNFELSSVEFQGKLAEKNKLREQSLKWVERTRFFILALAGVVLLPVLVNYLLYDFFSMDIFVKRILISLVLFLCFLVFRALSLASMLISLFCVGFLLIDYFTHTSVLSFQRLGFNCAIFSLIIFGIYHHFKAIKLGDELAQAIKNKNPEVIL